MPRPYHRPLLRGSQFKRQWDLLVELRSRAWTLSTLAKKFNCCERTIRRDLELLQAVGFPIYHVVGGAEWGESLYWKLGPMNEWPKSEVAPVGCWTRTDVD
jgi:hypothetical protein